MPIPAVKKRKKMKTCFSNAELPHIWISQKQSEGKANNFFFARDIIYSYGYHFPVARVDEKNKSVLFTTHHRSQTTSKHIRYTSQAISNEYKIYHVPHVNKNYEKENFAYMVDQINANIDKALKSKNNAVRIFAELAKDFETLKQYTSTYVKEFKHDKKALKAIATRLENPILIEKVSRQQKNYTEIEQKSLEREKVREEKEAIEFGEKLPKWQAGEISTNNLPHSETIYMRIIDDTIETSLGVKINLVAGIRAYNAYKNNTLVAGHTIGDYTIREITPEYVLIGCHKLEREMFDEFFRNMDLTLKANQDFCKSWNEREG